MSVVRPAGNDHPSPTAGSPHSLQGRWMIGVGLLCVACLAQGALWARTWEDPTNFKMSILYVWPAALFSLLIWWAFFSGWSADVRFGSVAAGLVCVIGFFVLFRLERFDGDMTPTIAVDHIDDAHHVSHRSPAIEAHRESPRGTSAPLADQRDCLGAIAVARARARARAL